MDEKTLSHLNSKAWYRLLKVLFGLMLLIALIIFNILLFANGIGRVNQSLTTIQCNLGSKSKFTAESLNLYLTSNDFPSGQFDYKRFFLGHSDYDINKIMAQCYPKHDTQNKYDDQKEAELIYKYGFVSSSSALTEAQLSTIDVAFQNYKKQVSVSEAAPESLYYGPVQLKYLDFSFGMFDITPTFTYVPVVRGFILGNLIILLISEALRRLFYYVALGKIRPAKS